MDVSFGSRGLYAYDMSGTLVWHRDFKIQMRNVQEFGEEAFGPVLDEGRLIVLTDDEGDGFLAMLDAATGRDIVYAAHRRHQLGGAARRPSRRAQADCRQQPAEGPWVR